MTALRIVPDAYNEVMKCVKQKVNLQKKFNPIYKLRKELKKLTKNIPKNVINQTKNILREKGILLAKQYSMLEIKIKKVCDNFEHL